MNLQQLRYIVTIAEMGSMNKASELLYVSQPNLTAAVKDLEAEYGFPIFTRTARGVTLTPDGVELVIYARQVLSQVEVMEERFLKTNSVRKRHFGVSTQHYSFAVQAFAEMVKRYGTANYDFAIRETRTREVIGDVAAQISEIGILYLSDFNRAALTKMLSSNGLSFHSLTECRAWVYLSRSHPLAGEKSISFAQLTDYPCLSFDQGGSGSFYFAEEILTTKEYPRTIHTNDRATNLNLMVALNAYTLCSGIICEELNGPDYVAIPFLDDEENHNSVMEIGYIVKKNLMLSEIGQTYVRELKAYLEKHSLPQNESAQL